jgi:hypothetical protein
LVGVLRGHVCDRGKGNGGRILRKWKWVLFLLSGLLLREGAQLEVERSPGEEYKRKIVTVLMCCKAVHDFSVVLQQV